MPKTPVFSSKFDFISYITGEEEIFSQTMRLPSQKRSFSSLDKLYYLKVDEINRPVFFSKSSSKETTDAALSETPILNELTKSEVLINSLDSASIKKAKYMTSESLSDHLGNNSKIDEYFEYNFNLIP